MNLSRKFWSVVVTLSPFALGAPLSVWAAEPAAAASEAKARAQAVAPKSTPKPTTKRATKATHSAKAVPAAEPATAESSEPVASDEHKLAVAKQVHTGRIACELGAHVTVTPDSARPTGFVVQLAGHVFHMSPVVSSTGAVRLEDAKSGAMWLQLGNKSMLMNTKLGQRMADECQSPAQLAVAESLKNNPPPSLLDEPGLARK